MRKTKQEKLINLKDLDNYKEKRNRLFRLTFVNHTEVQRVEKCFQSKWILKKYLKEHPKITKIKLYVLDVVYYDD